MSIVLVVVLVSSCYLSLATDTIVDAENPSTDSTLADAINTIANNVNWTNFESTTAMWGPILTRTDETVFDDAIIQDIDRRDYLDALYVARLASLNNYSSPILQAKTIEALQQINMAGGLPITTNAHAYGDPGNGAFSVYYRYMVYCYEYAQEYGLGDKWNATQAYLDFKKAYLSKPSGSSSGEMLWVDPAYNWSASFSSRYYDEHAETMGMFLGFADLGIPEAMIYADDAWVHVQDHWNGQYYGYTNKYTVECEMANFAELAAAYKQRSGNSIYWDRVIADLNYTLLANEWSSPGWAQQGVIVHATSNSQQRLWETTSAIIALQQFYPYFTDEMKSSFTDMLMGDEPAWKGLIKSSLNVNGSFMGAGGYSTTNEATACAAGTLFLEGIVPTSGSLDIPVSNEYYQDCRTCLRLADLQFDYANHLIKIPVTAGAFTFIYGSIPLSYTFPTNGTYIIKFADDWNSIIEVDNLNPNQTPHLTVNVKNYAPNLTWSFPNATQHQTYEIFRGTSSDNATLLATTNHTYYVDSDAVNGDQYYYYVCTVANQTTNVVNINFDYAPPVSTSYSPGWHSDDFSVNLSVPERSGNVTIYYRINGGETQNATAAGQPLITIESDNNTIEYWSVSPQGIASTHKILTGLSLDRTAPELAISIDDGSQSTSNLYVKLSVVAADLSGIAEMRFSEDNESWSVWEKFTPTKVWALSEVIGLHEVFVQVRNGAGLISTRNSSILLTNLMPSVTPTPTSEPTPTPTFEPTATPTPHIHTHTKTLTPSPSPPITLPSNSPTTPPIPEFSSIALVGFCILGLALVLIVKTKRLPL